MFRPNNFLHLHILITDTGINMYFETSRVLDNNSEDFFKPTYLLDFKVHFGCSIISVGVLCIEFTSEEACV